MPEKIVFDFFFKIEEITQNWQKESKIRLPKNFNCEKEKLNSFRNSFYNFLEQFTLQVSLFLTEFTDQE